MTDPNDYTTHDKLIELFLEYPARLRYEAMYGEFREPERVYIIANSHDLFMSWCRKHKKRPNREAVYIDLPEKLYGLKRGTKLLDISYWQESFVDLHREIEVRAKSLGLEIVFSLE